MPEPDTFVTNVCFGGDGYRTAFITSSGRGLLYSMEWPRPGLQLNFELHAASAGGPSAPSRRPNAPSEVGTAAATG